jgi:hypothetical protein
MNTKLPAPGGGVRQCRDQPHGPMTTRPGRAARSRHPPNAPRMPGEHTPGGRDSAPERTLHSAALTLTGHPAAGTTTSPSAARPAGTPARPGTRGPARHPSRSDPARRARQPARTTTCPATPGVRAGPITHPHHQNGHRR